MTALPGDPAAASPLGFAPHTSGLLVPESVARRREVWTREDWKVVNRAAKVLNDRHVGTLMRCRVPECPSPVLEATRELDGGLLLRCGCTDRHFRQ